MLYDAHKQMGSNFKSAVLEKQTMKVIREWHSEVKRKRQKNQSTQDYSSTTMDHCNTTISSSPEHVSSRHNRSPTFADHQLARFSVDTDIVEDHQEIGQNQPDQPAVLSSHVVQDIEIQVEEKPTLIG